MAVKFFADQRQAPMALLTMRELFEHDDALRLSVFRMHNCTAIAEMRVQKLDKCLEKA